MPVEQELRATLEGQTGARRQLVERVAPREGPQSQHRGALTDGAAALQQQVRTHLPEQTLVRDSIHATTYWWDTANAGLGATHPPRTAWVRRSLEPRVTGQTAAVITARDAEATDPLWTATQRPAVRRTVGDDRRTRPSRRDAAYLAQGWPIGPGVIEGACRHRVNDGLEPSGMRWTNAGAPAVLDRRAVRLHEPWDRSWPLHRHQHQTRLYGSSAPMPEQAEGQALQLAA